MKRNIKSVILTVILAFAFALTGCKFSANNTEKAKKQNTNTPSTNPSGDNSEDPELELDSSELPLTLEAITAGRIILSGKDSFERISIQKGNGLIFDVADNIDVQPGDIIRFYGSKYISDGSVNLTIECTADCYVYGNAMSLLYYTNFKGKTQITQNYVLQKLFLNNTHIKNHETLDIVLPATTLSEGCYKKMFYGCTGLTRAPELPALTLAKECYNSMFFGCNNLNSIKCLATDISAYNCTKDWIYKVADTGSFTSALENNIWRYKNKTSGIPVGWFADPPFAFVDAKQLPLTLEAIEDGNILLKNINEFMNLQYSKNEGVKIAATETIEVSSGDKVCFYAEGPANEDNRFLTINCTNYCYIYGNIMSLIDPQNFKTGNQLEKEKCFANLFYNNNHIKNNYIELILPATTITESCYYYMFDGCTGLTTAPALPATTLAESCYSYMFEDCTGLTTAPELPATTLAESCYSYMFYYCTSLTTAPELPATILAESCYSHMFEDCKSLITTPELPATKLAPNCYYAMFSSCTGLTTALELPAAILARYCYYAMFSSCTGLTTAPALPATTLATSCYSCMFKSCTGLTTAPELPATTLATSCYNSMFYNCTSLTTAPVLPAKTLVQSCYFSMFYGCSNIHFIECLGENYVGYMNLLPGNSDYGFLYCSDPSIWSRETQVENKKWGVFDDNNLPLTMEVIQDGKIKIENSNEYNNLRCLYNYNTILNNVNSIDVLAGDKIFFFAAGPKNDDSTYLKIKCTSDCYIYGNIMSIIDQGDFTNNKELLKANSFNSLFKYNTHIKNHPEKTLVLPAITLTSGCYSHMFNGCTGLTTAPALPAETLKESCYSYMFNGCTGLTTAPALPATTLASSCYESMFAYCANLTTAPALPATTLKANCYYSMFERCTSLTTAPELQATTLASSCYYYMFDGCKGLITAPELPATTLAESCCSHMFNGCYGLTTAPALPAETLKENCYSSMFNGCTGLTRAPELSATTLASSCYSSMFNGCTGLTTAPALPAETLKEKCYSSMFNGCTGLTRAPNLPATTLAESCYSEMFKFCANLTIAPELSAPTLAKKCYYYMFQYCTGLTTAPALPAETLKENCYTYMFNGCTGLTTAPALPAETLAFGCYSYMFKDCTGLTTAPELRATTLASSCYSNMFNGCTGLTTAPALPATTLKSSCYSYMFNGCTGLTTAPALLATTLVESCYSYMFNGCTGLITAPELPAAKLELSCYKEMFLNCSNLNYVKCLATDISASGCITDWLEGVAKTGTFIRANDTVNWLIGSSGIPDDWEVEDYVAP